MFYVYLLLSLKDGTFYVGQTDSTDKRLTRHNSGYVPSTKSRRPWVLVGYEKYKTRNEARWREYILKQNHLLKNEFINKLTSFHSSMDRA